MRSFFRSLFFILFFISYSFAHSQELNITGKVIDSTVAKPIGLASVVLYKFKTRSILTYTTTSRDGFFELKTPIKLGIYTLKINHLSYQPIEREIVVSEDTDISINVNFELVQKVNRLEEIIIKKESPIIIKKDTIIYDVKHWTQKNDQTLEEVLGKIEGFRILPNGEIEVNGELIKKVLIDGKEVSNAGASLLTKSIDPNDIEKIEVRFNEQNNKIKESLLDTKEYVVLDIKFKKGINKSFFGKIRTTVGYLNQAKLGGYTNLFSINKKVNFHLFSEHDDFGHQTISLDQIRNIGREAFQKIFELPADFQSLIKREGYQSEIYGFKDYTLANRNVIGFTSKFELSKKWMLYIGSYNSLNKTNQGKNIEQNFNSIVHKFEEIKTLEMSKSKNKLELRFDNTKTKFRFDTNFIYGEPKQNTISKFSDQNRVYNFNNRRTTVSFYNNLFFERKISSKLGLEFKVSHSKINSIKNIDFRHNNPEYFLSKINNDSLFTQEISSKVNQTNAQIMLQYQSKIGVVKLGNLFENSTLNYQSKSEVLSFSQEGENYSFQRIKPFLNHIINFGDISFSNNIGYSFIEYTTLSGTREKTTVLDYYTMLRFSIYDIIDDITISYDNRLSLLPLRKLTKANTIIDFQTIETPAEMIAPKKESVVSLYIGKKFDELKFDLSFNMLSGNNSTANKFINTGSSFLESQKNQLKSNYQLFSINLTKRLEKLPIIFILEPEAIFNNSENSIDDINYELKTKRYLIGFKINTNLKKKWYDFNLYPKFTRFHFKNTLSKVTSNQDMFSLSLNTTLKLMKDNMFIDLGIRRVDFFRGITSKYTNLNATFSGDIKKIRWFLTISNISNDKKFVQKNIFPNYFVSQSNQVFGRFIKFGIEYKFK